MQTTLIGVGVLVILVVLYFILKRSQHSDKNLPAVSEDKNLPQDLPPSQN